MADLSRRASLSGATFPPISLPAPPHDFGHFNFGGRNDNNAQQQQPAPPPPSSAQQQQQQQQASSNSNSNPVHSPNQFQHNAPPVYDHPSSSAPTNSNNAPNSTSTSSGVPPPGNGGGGNGQQQRPGFSNQRRESNVPGWAVPPRVLLVEDDSVCRKLSSKFLEIFGCDIDLAVDGVSAVNKMKMQKYDLVLMVRQSLLYPLSKEGS
jgi:osomolarity two-component system response regulator SKN7